MTVDIKYEIDTKVWVVYIFQGELHVYSDTLDSFIIHKNEQYYLSKEGCCEIKEDEIILYEDKDKLYKTICEKMNEIRKK